MKFFYHPNASEDFVTIQGDLYNHIYRSRRSDANQDLTLSNLKDDILYTYKHSSITRNKSELILFNQTFSPNRPIDSPHLIWAIIDNKNIEKSLPYLNQLGVSKISFFYANRSQKNEKISLERLQKILIHSCEQCGRSALMELEIFSTTREALKTYPNASVLDFGGQKLAKNFREGIFIGPEGGFDDEEKKLFTNQKIYSIEQNFTLKSECATFLIASFSLGC